VYRPQICGIWQFMAVLRNFPVAETPRKSMSCVACQRGRDDFGKLPILRT
jgi:hypothetical protein